MSDHYLDPLVMVRKTNGNDHQIYKTKYLRIDLKLVRRLETLRAQARRTAHPRPTRPTWPRP